MTLATIRCAIWLMLLLCLPLHAATYPRTVTDLAGRQVTLQHAPQRILLQDSNDLLTLALLDRDNPLQRVIAWGNNLASSDPALWHVVAERWPQATHIRQVEFMQSGQIDIEGLLRTHPDLVIARLEAQPAIENTVLYSVLERLGIPLLYVDNEQDPLQHVPRSVALLGQALAREAQAQAYLTAYDQRLRTLLATAHGLPAPRVFVEARAGQAGTGGCCHTQGDSGWGLLVQHVGGINLGSQYLRSASADVALETLILSKPDLYLMTGTQRVRNGVTAIPFGYGASTADVHTALQRLMQRPGFAALAPAADACVQGLNHQFYNSVFNIVGAQWLAKLFWPQHFADLDPDHEYRQLIAEFTTLPARPFVFHGQACFANLDAP
ncbi:ABC transporter substrate-binding protein [Pseudomonas sp. PSKL.D1]|uniref:ABC transporter substrate-binding protein n=1 Tax=Pseudomonas sp. PSKL.D1 TaxID=3029060 RepID=UPI002380ED33|nr:ABC transporter substrate-binding protein [Pseudomonas sp. PSKL.D1]WDY59827.1 ABC transporter substrate-binding protein [Pseudomonas sp. PSKL.D1]